MPSSTIKFLLPLSSITLLVAALPGQLGPVLFDDDFESWLPENTFIPDPDLFYPEDHDGLIWSGKPGGGGDVAPLPAHTFFRTDSENIFGRSPDNTVMQWGNAGTIQIGSETWIIGDKTRLSTRNLSELDERTTLVTSGVVVVSFEFYEPAQGSSNGLSSVDQRTFLRIRGDSVDGVSSTNINGFRIDDGIRDPARGGGSGEAVTTPGVVYEVLILFNVSGSEYAYTGLEGSSETLSAGAADLWLKPGSKAGGAPWELAIEEHIDGSGFPEAFVERVYWELDYPWGPVSAQEIWIDDWTVSDGLAQPPSTSFWAESPLRGGGWRFSGEGYPGEAGIGWIYDALWPWVYTLGIEGAPEGRWIWVLAEGGSRDGFYAWVARDDAWIYGLSDGFYYRFDASSPGWFSFQF